MPKFFHLSFFFLRKKKSFNIIFSLKLLLYYFFFIFFLFIFFFILFYFFFEQWIKIIDFYKQSLPKNNRYSIKECNLRMEEWFLDNDACWAQLDYDRWAAGCFEGRGAGLPGPWPCLATGPSSIVRQREYLVDPKEGQEGGPGPPEYSHFRPVLLLTRLLHRLLCDFHLESSFLRLRAQIKERYFRYSRNLIVLSKCFYFIYYKVNMEKIRASMVFEGSL